MQRQKQNRAVITSANTEDITAYSTMSTCASFWTVESFAICCLIEAAKITSLVKIWTIIPLQGIRLLNDIRLTCWQQNLWKSTENVSLLLCSWQWISHLWVNCDVTVSIKQLKTVTLKLSWGLMSLESWYWASGGAQRPPSPHGHCGVRGAVVTPLSCYQVFNLTTLRARKCLRLEHSSMHCCCRHCAPASDSFTVRH